MEDKVYINGIFIKEHVFDDGNKILKLSVNKDGIEQLQSLLNGDGWLNVDIKERREVSDKGLTHYMQLNTFKPKDASPHDPGDENDNEDKLPF